jgi:hypothetical protein
MAESLGVGTRLAGRILVQHTSKSCWPLSLTVALDFLMGKRGAGTRRGGRTRVEIWREGREARARDALLSGTEVQNESYHLQVLLHYHLLEDLHKNTV